MDPTTRETTGGRAPADAELVRAFLSDRDVPCPRCGYNLRTQRKAVCPECGLQLALSLRPTESLHGPWITAMCIVGSMALLGLFFAGMVVRWGWPGSGWEVSNVVMSIYMGMIPLALLLSVYRGRFVRLARPAQHASWVSAAIVALVMLVMLVFSVQ